MVFKARELGIEVRLARMEDPLPDGPWDLVISVLSVHHLDSEQKRDLFRRVREQSRALVMGDVVIAEQQVTPLEEGVDMPSRAEELVEWCGGELVWEADDLAVIRATYESTPCPTPDHHPRGESMAKEPRSMRRQGRRNHRRRPRNRQGDRGRARRARAPRSRSATWTSRSPKRRRPSWAPRRIGLELDVTDRDSFANFLDQVSERLGPLDVLINNAGIMPIGPFVDETDATAQRMVDINLHGVIYGMKLTIPRHAAARRGSHRQHRLAGREGRASRAAPPIARPSTPSSA